jgi:hypothetical protein
MRERPGVSVPKTSKMGITPACAGKTSGQRCSCWARGDHPRVCGKDISFFRVCPRREGSPPRVRERHGLLVVEYTPRRITPACAGKTLDRFPCNRHEGSEKRSVSFTSVRKRRLTPPEKSPTPICVIFHYSDISLPVPATPPPIIPSYSPVRNVGRPEP